MVIRCVCGNETHITPGAKPGYFLRDDASFDAQKKELRCPKCKSTALPLELLETRSNGAIIVQVVPGRTIAKSPLWS